MPALRTLRRQVLRVSQDRKQLIGLDGRPIPIRSPHSALNALLQSCGSILTKKSTTLMHARFKNVQQVAHIHDEIQLECEEKIAKYVGVIAVKSIKDAGEYFNLRCALDGEYKIGKTWADTH